MTFFSFIYIHIIMYLKDEDRNKCSFAMHMCRSFTMMSRSGYLLFCCFCLWKSLNDRDTEKKNSEIILVDIIPGITNTHALYFTQTPDIISNSNNKNNKMRNERKKLIANEKIINNTNVLCALRAQYAAPHYFSIYILPAMEH